MRRRRALGPLSRLLLGCGSALALAAACLQLVAWVQATTYRQAGVRTPWAESGVGLPTPLVTVETVLTPALAPSADDRSFGEGGLSPAAPTSDPDQTGEGLPPPAQPDVLAPPRRLRIPAIGVDSAIVELGFTARGEWELPTLDVGWYGHTAVPRARGTAVLIGDRRCQGRRTLHGSGRRAVGRGRGAGSGHNDCR